MDRVVLDYVLLDQQISRFLYANFENLREGLVKVDFVYLERSCVGCLRC